MSMTERHEPRERPDRPASRNHTPRNPNQHMAINPYPLTTAPPYGRRSVRTGAVERRRSALATIGWVGVAGGTES